MPNETAAPAILDPYTESDAAPVADAAAPESAPAAAPQAAPLAIPQPNLERMEAEHAAAEARLAQEREAHSKHGRLVADYQAAAAAADEELKTCDLASMDAVMQKKRRAEDNLAALRFRAAAYESRVKAAEADLDATALKRDEARLDVLRLHQEALDAELLKRAHAAAAIIGDIFELMTKAAREASSIRRSVEIAKGDDAARMRDCDLRTPYLRVADNHQPSNASDLERAAAVLRWVQVESPRAEADAAELRRRSQPADAKYEVGQMTPFGKKVMTERNVPTFSAITSAAGKE